MRTERSALPALVPERLAHMREQVHIPRTKHKTPPKLKRILPQPVLPMPTRLRPRPRFRIVLPQQMQDIRLPQSHGSIRPALLVNQQRKRDAGLVTKCPRIGPIAHPDGCQIQLVLVFAQLRDVLAAEDSAIVTKKHHHRWRRFPKRAQADFATIGIGQNELRERCAERLGHANSSILADLKIPIIVALFIGLLSAATPDPEIAEIQADLTAITGLRFERPVPVKRIGRDELRRFLERQIQKSVKPEDLRAEELALKMFGLIPQDYSLRSATVDLLTEQAAAFYDYRHKKLYLLDSNSDPEARVALAHELAHALADQHFRLDRFIRDNSQNDDAATARLSVMEGQASWLMAAWLARQSGGPDVPPPAVLKAAARSMEEGAGRYPVFAGAPLYIRESLLFPYREGMLFQNAVFEKLGREGFAEVFRRPPSSTQQILHPEDYFTARTPAIPEAPGVEDEKHFRRLAEGTLGEFDVRILLEQYAGKEIAGELGTQMAGCFFRLLEHKHERFPVLAFAVTWKSPEAAGRFFEQYAKILRAKWKTYEVTTQTADSLSGRGDSGRFQIHLTGARVDVVEGLPPGSLH